MYEVEDVNRRKAFAVAVLSEVWAGAKLPPQLVQHAENIRREMLSEGTWEIA